MLGLRVALKLGIKRGKRSMYFSLRFLFDLPFRTWTYPSKIEQENGRDVGDAGTANRLRLHDGRRVVRQVQEDQEEEESQAKDVEGRRPLAADYRRRGRGGEDQPEHRSGRPHGHRRRWWCGSSCRYVKCQSRRWTGLMNIDIFIFWNIFLTKDKFRAFVFLFCKKHKWTPSSMIY